MYLKLSEIKYLHNSVQISEVKLVGLHSEEDLK